ncbi:hypothetical protein [Cohnella sp. JJ-181]|uniref:hypothetical protein n=1 Tax=Cohnella rhizoplanae TaxID=2974897 RepID=UPI0022FFAFCF|nr:hypothetical protein [Cohnella sp. JJ-181]CAI6086712.1 hypothetical protein COHCIP112018_05140 [Cohnella sp. JJ-181]
MLDWIDYALLAVYTVTVGCATYVLAAHRKYFHERFRKGVVSAFMLSMLFFLAAYDFKMITAVWIRASVAFGWQTPRMDAAQRLTWLIVTGGTMVGLLLLAYQTYTRKYDLWIRLRRRDSEREDDAE